MKRNKTIFILLIAFAAIFFSFSTTENKQLAGPGRQLQPVHAGLPLFFSFGDEKIVKAAEFPDIDYFRNVSESKYYDAGVKFKQITIFFLPVWNYDAEWCGYIGVNDKYLPMTYADVSQDAKSANVTLPGSPESAIPFWDKFGGKLIIILIVLLYFFFKNKR